MDITLSYLTLSGARYDHPPQADMLTRAMAASDMGCPRIGVSLREDPSPDTLKWADVPELEWVNIDRPVTNKLLDRIRMFRDTLGCTRINVGVCTRTADLTGVPWRMGTIARETGLTVALEPVVFGSLSSVTDCAKLARQSGDPRVGVLFDMWQVWMAGTAGMVMNPDSLVRDITEVQISGIPAWRPAASHMLRASQNRPLIGSSAVSIASWLTRLLRAGYTGPVSYENPWQARDDEVLTKRASIAARDLSVLDGYLADMGVPA